ncbi:MAG: lysine--tRNA ligase [Bacilli bacterium]|jgi:lysyl-tRNA synthetase class 2
MELTEQETVRREKLKNITQYTNSYPDRFEITHELTEAKELADGTKGVRVAGRILLMRVMGKLTFIKISDLYGSIQLAIKSDMVGEEQYEFFKSYFDIGDYIGVEGEMFTTNTGERTVRVSTFYFLGKALKPLPEKFHGLTDPELCYRKRYVDLIMNEDTRKRFILRFEFLKHIRRYLEDLGYTEIETPVLMNKPSGALARPFIAHHNALDMDVYLRIAPETYLKRAVVAGINKVFEVARCFRNEGVDSTHIQDFTMIEGYCAYYNYKDTMDLIRDMLTTVLKKILGTTVINLGGNQIDLAQEWKVVTFRDVILEHTSIDINVYNTKELLLGKIQELDLQLESETDIKLLGFGNLVDLLYKRMARPKIINPTFLIEHPIELSPLARANDENIKVADRFQLIINGAEMVNAYSELVDPIEQRKRLEEQAKLNAAGDEDAMVMDNDYIDAMEYGMPPISGWGLGVDRFLQVITESPNIRDVVMFPLMRPLDKD